MEIVAFCKKQEVTSDNEKGFTLVELMVAIVIGLIVTAAVSGFFINEKRLYESQKEIIDMQQDLRTSLSIMTSEIRMAGYDPDNTGLFFIEKAESNELIFSVDMDEDGVIDDGERIRYGLNKSGHLCRATGNDAADLKFLDEDADPDNDEIDVLLFNVDELNFVYLDEDHNVNNDISEMRAVQIAIVARSDNAVTSSMGGASDEHKFKNLQGDEIFDAAEGEKYIRRLMLTELKFRNLGIKR